MKGMTMSNIFLWRWDLVIVRYDVWNKTPESIFQFTRGQRGICVNPGSISCCFLWVRYRVKARLACTVAKAAVIHWLKMQGRIYVIWHQWPSW